MGHIYLQMQGVDSVFESERWGWQMACGIKPKKKNGKRISNFEISQKKNNEDTMLKFWKLIKYNVRKRNFEQK